MSDTVESADGMVDTSEQQSDNSLIVILIVALITIDVVLLTIIALQKGYGKGITPKSARSLARIAD